MTSKAVLDYDIVLPEDAGDGTPVAVLLHGRGSHKGDLQALRPVVPDDWAVVTPQAPNPGAAWGYGEGWAWYRYIQEDQVDGPSLIDSLARLESFLSGLDDIVGFTPGPVVLGGFSQGGTMSVAYALSRPGAVLAALNFSGFLATAVDVPTGDAAANATPIFWGHGMSDAAIPFTLALRGRQTLSKAGVPLVSMDYGIGHWMVPDEIHDAMAMVGSIRDQSPHIP